MKNTDAFTTDAMAFLKDNVTAVIATCFEGHPHASTVYYDVDDAFNFYYLTKRNTLKNIHPAFNSHAAIVVGAGPERISIQAQGEIIFLTGKDKEDAFNRMIARYTEKKIKGLPIMTMKELAHSPFVAYKIMTTNLVFMNMDSEEYPKSISREYHHIQQ